MPLDILGTVILISVKIIEILKFEQIEFRKMNHCFFYDISKLVKTELGVFKWSICDPKLTKTPSSSRYKKKKTDKTKKRFLLSLEDGFDGFKYQFIDLGKTLVGAKWQDREKWT